MSLLRLTRPLNLILAALTYAFGVSIADYLGKALRVQSFWFGFLIVILIQVTMSLLPEVYRPHNEPLIENETRKDRLVLRNNALYISLTTLSAIAVFAYILFNNKLLPSLSLLFLVFSLFLVFINAVPPFRLINRGFGELLLAVQVAYIFPTFAFTLQTGKTHSFLALTMPLTFLAFAYFIVLDFQAFAQDQKYQRVTFLTRLGWETVVPLHHAFILFAYIFFLAMPAFGLSLNIIWSAFLTLPFAVFQINQLRNISLGAPTNWILLNTTAIAVFGLTTYFLTSTFWLR